MSRRLAAILATLVIVSAGAVPAHASAQNTVCRIYLGSPDQYDCDSAASAAEVTSELNAYRGWVRDHGDKDFAVVYQDVNYGGIVSLLYVGYGCNERPTWNRIVALDAIPGPGYGWWSDRISSFQNANSWPYGAQCTSRWYDDGGGLSGNYLWYQANGPDVPSMPAGWNDRVESIDFYS